jgi:SAM-dependent methyltransferase
MFFTIFSGKWVFINIRGGSMRSSIPFYNALAQEYNTVYYQVPYRKVYDQLAWELVSKLLPGGGDATLVDAGCGAGHWIERLLPLGYNIVGIEQAPAMIDLLRRKNFGHRFSLIAGSIEDAFIESASVDAILSMGSLQYTKQPALTIKHFSEWVKPGGLVAVLVDSYVSLILELLNRDLTDEALTRMDTRLAVWRQGDHETEYHLLDKRTLEAYFAQAGLQRISSYGLLVTFSAWGRPKLQEAILRDERSVLSLEKRLSECPELVDVAKQILVCGYRQSK